MPVPSLITDLTTVAATNSPPGSESPATADDYFRAHASFIAQLRDGKVPLDSATGAARMPAGTTAQRPAGALGDLRRNTTTARWEWYDGSSWVELVDGIGIGQTWQSLIASRALGVTYTNTTGRAIGVMASATTGVAASLTLSIVIGGVDTGVTPTTLAVSGSYTHTGMFIVPAGDTFAVNVFSGTPVLQRWYELR